jgi:hypothetical protein
MPVIDQERRLIRYLLGELSKDERAEIEDDYVATTESFDQLLVAEDQLIDDYVRGRLAEKDRRLFEKNFLSTSGRRERVRSARALLAFADKHGTPQRSPGGYLRGLVASLLSSEQPVMRWALVALLVVVVIGGPLAFLRINTLDSQVETLREGQLAQQRKAQELEQLIARQKDSFDKAREDDRAERGRIEQELENVREEAARATPAVPPLVVSFESAGSGGSTAAGAGARAVVIPKDKPRVQFRFKVLDSQSGNNLVVLTDSQGSEIWRGTVRSIQNEIKITLASRLFSTGAYSIAVNHRDGASGFTRYYNILVDVK